MPRVTIEGDDIAREIAERGIDHGDVDGLAEALSDLADRAKVEFRIQEQTAVDNALRGLADEAEEFGAAFESDRRQKAEAEASEILARVRSR